MQKVMPTTYLLAAILAILLLHFTIPILHILPSPWNLLGLLPLAFGVWINLAADRAFKQAATTVKPFQPSSALIQDGVFRYTRNPMYLGFIAVLLGISVLLGSLSPYLVVALFAFLMDLVYIQSEEKMLQDVFGSRWEEYRTRTRKWL
jgi:protein-S-isoprenylcysteine O-methyltransferase Ste14